MKYCYTCGTPYTREYCPKCVCQCYTDKPNSQTKKLEERAVENNTKIKLPKKYEGKIESIDKDSDGYWAYTTYGWYFPEMECHTAHEDSQKELMRVIRTVAPCTCKECTEELNKLKEQGGQTNGKM